MILIINYLAFKCRWKVLLCPACIGYRPLAPLHNAHSLKTLQHNRQAAWNRFKENEPRHGLIDERLRLKLALALFIA